MSIKTINQLLQDEVLDQIYRYLSDEDKKNFPLVCTIIFGANVPNRSLNQVLNSYRNMENATISHLTSRLPRLSHPNNNFPLIKEIILGQKNSQATILNLLKYGCPRAESLVIPSSALAPMRRYVISEALPMILWNNLRKLKLEVVMYKPSMTDKKHFKTSSTFLKFAKIPNIQELDFSFTFESRIDSKIQKQIQRLFANLLKFIAENPESLKNLSLDLWYFNRRHFEQTPPGGQLNVERNPTINSLLEKIGRALKLESICLNINGFVEPPVFPELFGTNLKSLEFNQYDSTPLADTFGEIFHANSKTLENIKIEALASNVSAAWFKDCASLKSLSLEVFRVKSKSVVPTTFKISELKSLKVHMYSRLSPWLKQVIMDSSPNLERLELSVLGLGSKVRRDGWRWMNDLVHLTYLKLEGFSMREQILREFEALPIWRNITELDLPSMIADHGVKIVKANWVQRNLPNLIKIRLWRPSVPELKIYLKMKKLEQITLLQFFRDPLMFHDKAVIRYCRRRRGVLLTQIPLEDPSFRCISDGLLRIDTSRIIR